MRETWVRSLGWEDNSGEGNGNPLQYSCLENPVDGGAWWATVHRVAKSWTRLSDFTFIFTFILLSVQFSSVTQSCPTLCDPMDCSTPDSLSITNSWSLLKLMCIKLVMPSNHLILCCPLLLPPLIIPSIRIFWF